MKLTKDYLRKLIVEELQGLSQISEGEDDAGADPFATDDEGGDDEAADEGGDEAEDPFATDDEGGDDEGGGEEEGGDEEGGEEEGGDEEGGDDAEEGEDEDTEAATGPSDFQIDNEINAVMADFEAEALQVAQVQSERKNPRLSLAKALLEGEGEEEVAIDVDNFAQNVARLIGNYQNLIDMEKVIYNKSRDFIEDKYGAEAVAELEDILATRYDIDLSTDADPELEDAASYAVGAANAQV